MHAGVNYGSLIINLLAISHSQSVNFPDIFGVQFYDFFCHFPLLFLFDFIPQGLKTLSFPIVPIES